MPKTYIADRDVTLSLPFLVDSPNGYDYVVPTTATATVRDHSGVAIPGYVDIDLAPTSTQATITVLAADNNKTRTIERRVIEYTFDGHSRELAYYLIDWVSIDVTPDDVRRLLGVNVSELPDTDIDIYGAYQALATQLGGITVMDAALDTDLLRANRAIALFEALRQIPALQLKAAKTVTSGQDGFTRFDVDWEALQRALKGALAAETSVITPTAVPATLFTTAGRTYDPFTGA
jgi:hypothetical protein